MLLISMLCFSREYYATDNLFTGSKPFEVQVKIEAGTFTLRISYINKNSADGLNYNYHVNTTILSEGIAALINKVDTSITATSLEIVNNNLTWFIHKFNANTKATN